MCCGSASLAARPEVTARNYRRFRFRYRARGRRFGERSAAVPNRDTDMPNASKFTVGIMALVAQQERGLNLHVMAAGLSTRGIRMRRDRTRTATAVQRVLQRGLVSV